MKHTPNQIAPYATKWQRYMVPPTITMWKQIPKRAQNSKTQYHHPPNSRFTQILHTTPHINKCNINASTTDAHTSKPLTWHCLHTRSHTNNMAYMPISQLHHMYTQIHIYPSPMNCTSHPNKTKKDKYNPLIEALRAQGKYNCWSSSHLE